MLAAEQTSEEDAGAVDCEQSTNGVEFGGEDLEHDEGKGELADCGADIGALESSLCCANLDQLIAGEDDGAGAVQMQTVSVCGVTALVEWLAAVGWMGGWVD